MEMGTRIDLAHLGHLSRSVLEESELPICIFSDDGDGRGNVDIIHYETEMWGNQASRLSEIGGGEASAESSRLLSAQSEERTKEAKVSRRRSF